MNENFCIIPFMVLNCRPNGSLKTCSQAEGAAPIEGFNLNTDSVEDFWNCDWMRDFRRRKIRGERIPQCEGCKRTEESGGGSKRQGYLDRYYEKYKHRIREDGYVEEMPAWWEFRLSSVCNSACRICTPKNSTLIEKEHTKHYNFIPEYDKKQLIGCSKKQLGDGGNFLNEFWKHVDQIDAIELHGGEPLIDDNVIMTLQQLVDTGHASRMHVHVHSNINKVDEYVVNLLNQFKSGWFGASIDAYGEENEFLRWPSKWKTVDHNFRSLKLHSQWRKSILSAITVYQCLSMWKFLDWFLEFQDDCDMFFYTVHSPDRFSLEMIDLNTRLHAAEELESYKPILHDRHHEKLDNLISNLKSTRTPLEKEYKGFIEYNNALDEIRNQDSFKLFPHIREIYETGSTKIHS